MFLHHKGKKIYLLLPPMELQVILMISLIFRIVFPSSPSLTLTTLVFYHLILKFLLLFKTPLYPSVPLSFLDSYPSLSLLSLLDFPKTPLSSVPFIFGYTANSVVLLDFPLSLSLFSCSEAILSVSAISAPL